MWMRIEGFQVTRTHESDHWWFRSRRDLFLLQVERALNASGQRSSRSRPHRLLDFGCGTGFNLGALSAFGEVYGADRLRPERERFCLSHQFPIIDAERELEQYGGAFDVVTALDVLEHLDDDVGGLVALGKLLAPGGQIVLTVPAYQWLWGGEDVISEHRRRYTKRNIEDVCRAARFSVEYSSYFNLSILPAMTAVVWGRKLLSRTREPRSNLSSPPDWLNELLYTITAFEATWVGLERVVMPAGASIVCRIRGSG